MWRLGGNEEVGLGGWLRRGLARRLADSLRGWVHGGPARWLWAGLTGGLAGTLRGWAREIGCVAVRMAAQRVG